MIHPYLRMTRMTSAALIFPEHPVPAAIASEVISTASPMIAPLFSNLFWKKILYAVTIFLYMPSMFHAYSDMVKDLKEDNTMYIQAEACLSLLFIMWKIVDYGALL